jgi:hypothetical protein
MRDVVEVYIREKKPGISTAYVYRTFIEPQFHISMATLYNYLSTPIAKCLKEEEAKKNKSIDVNA